MKLISIVILLMLPLMALAQPKLKKKKAMYRNTEILEIFNVLASDKNIKHGDYKRMYWGHLLCDGEYINGQPGIFTYYEDKEKANLQYDYIADSLIYYHGSAKLDSYLSIKKREIPEHPPIPLISIKELRIQIGLTINYPKSAQVEGISGKPLVAIKINKEGAIEGYSIIKSVHQDLDKEAIKVVTEVTKDLTWIPAKHNGENRTVYVFVPISFLIK